MENFEGYVGIHMYEVQWVDDIILTLLLLLFASFAFCFHRYGHYFVRMAKDVVYVKKHVSLFEETKGDDTPFYRYMVSQFLLLSALAILLLAYKSHVLEVKAAWEIPLLLLLILAALLLYYQLKRFLNYLIALVFVNNEGYELWRVGYRAIVSMWGVLLYIPVAVLLLWNGSVMYSFLFLVLLYMLSRLVIIYKIIRIFSIKKGDCLYLLLYLCAQEITPLLLLIAGVYYLYNFIEMTTLWR